MLKEWRFCHSYDDKQPFIDTTVFVTFRSNWTRVGFYGWSRDDHSPRKTVVLRWFQCWVPRKRCSLSKCFCWLRWNIKSRSETNIIRTRFIFNKKTVVNWVSLAYVSWRTPAKKENFQLKTDGGTWGPGDVLPQTHVSHSFTVLVSI